MATKQLNHRYLSRAKISYSTRRVHINDATMILNGATIPRAGDVLLAEVKKIGQHKRLELANGRRAHLFIGDRIVISYGNRYASNQFEAVVPDKVKPCHLVAAGGVAGRMITKHEGMKHPTVISPVGILADSQGHSMNLSRYAVKRKQGDSQRIPVYAVVGTSMDSGKTTTMASLIRGLRSAGMKVGAAKVTGTGAGGDNWITKDAGADEVLDFTDAGYASTYRLPLIRILEIFDLILNNLRCSGVDVIVLEIADGMYQEETAGLLSTSQFIEAVDGLIFTSRDSLGAHMGLEWLRERHLPVLALSGLFTRSPLTIREIIETTGFPVLSPNILVAPDIGEILKNLLTQRTSSEAVISKSM